jgi:uncharacterized membrane protein
VSASADPRRVGAAKNQRDDAQSGLQRDDQERVDSKTPLDLGLDRIVFLSDGLFAIALTILVIDLRLPDLPAAAGSAEISNAISDLAPRVFAYGLSFTIISLYWVAHLRRFKLIERANSGLAYLNLLLLAFIAVIPFPTALIGEHGDLPLPVVIYAGTLSAAGIAGFLSWVYALRAGLVKPDAPQDLVRSNAIRGLATPASCSVPCSSCHSQAPTSSRCPGC